MVVTGIVLGFSLQLVGAWVSAPGSPQANNIGAPINTGGQTQTKPGTLGVGALNAGTFVLQNGTQGAGKVLVSDANGVASWQSLDCKKAPICQGANNCIKTDGSCGKLQIEVSGGSNLGVSCNNQRDFVYPDGENPAYFDRSCSFDSGRLTIDVHARVYCRGKWKSIPPNQGGAACVNSDGTYGWVQAYVQSGLTNGECGIDWSWTPYDLKPDFLYHLHAECGDGGGAGRRDYNMDTIWRCI